MQLKIEQMDAWQVLHALGIEVKEVSPRNYVFEDAGLRFRVDQGGIVELTESGKFIAGSILDFLAFRSGSYESAIDYLICTYGSLLTGGSYSPELYRDVTIGEAAERRAKFMTFIRMRGNIVNDPQLAIVNMWMTKQGLNPLAVAPFVLGITGQAIHGLIDAKFDTKGTYACFPYMRNPWTIAAWRVVDVRTGVDQWVEVERCRTTFFGILGTHWIESRILRKDMEVCRVYSAEFASADKMRGVVCVRQTPANQYNDYRLNVGIAYSTHSLKDIILHRRNFHSLQVQLPDNTRVMSQQFVTGELARLLTSEKIDPTIREVLTFIRHEQDLVVGLQQDLKDAKLFSQATKLQVLLDQLRVYRSGPYEIRETTTGLIAIKGTEHIALTNFLIHIDYALTFMDAGKMSEVFYAGRLIFDNRTYPVSIRKKDLTKPDVLEFLAQAAVSETLPDSASKLPCILDSTHSKLIRAIMVQQVSEVMSRRGVGALGWTGLDVYETPSWVIRTTGVQTSSRIPHPGRKHFDQFCCFTEVPTCDLKQEVPPAARTAIALVVAMILRAYLKAPLGPIEVHAGKDTTEILTAVLLGLEQKGPLYITDVGVKWAFEAMNGFPCMVKCAAPELLRTLSYPCFIVSPTGAVIGAPMTPEQKCQVIWLARNIFHSVIQGFLRTRGVSHQLVSRELPNYPVLLREGQAAIERYTDHRGNYLLSNETPLLFEILLRCAPVDPSRLFKFSLVDQAAIALVRRMNKSRSTLMGELQAAGLNPRPYGAKNLLVDAERLTALLSDFYGRPIKLRIDDSAEDPEEPGQDDVSGLSQVGQS